jgi:hypothetical protein
MQGIGYYHIHHKGLVKEKNRQDKVLVPSNGDIALMRVSGIRGFLFVPVDNNINPMRIKVNFFYGSLEKNQTMKVNIDLGEFDI